VIGVPDAARGEVIKAFIVPRAGVATSEALATEIRGFVRARLAAHEAPRQIAFVDALPLTATGKVMRRELRARTRRDG
jgi:acetyl-CoA synthetase